MNAAGAIAAGGAGLVGGYGIQQSVKAGMTNRREQQLEAREKFGDLEEWQVGGLEKRDRNLLRSDLVTPTDAEAAGGVSIAIAGVAVMGAAGMAGFMNGVSSGGGSGYGGWALLGAGLAAGGIANAVTQLT